MSIFSDLLKIPNPPIRWVVVLGATRKADGAVVEFHCTKGQAFRAVLDGEVVHFRDAWVSEIETEVAVTRSPSGGDSNRSFFDTGAAGVGEQKWRLRPDQQMLWMLAGVTLDGGFELAGWGAAQADGSPFAWEDRHTQVRGKIVRDQALEGGAVIEVTYAGDVYDFGQPVVREKFGGFGAGQEGFTPATGDPAAGLWMESAPTTAFDVDGASPAFTGYSAEAIMVMREFPGAGFDFRVNLAVSGPQDAFNSNSWALITRADDLLVFASKALRFDTTFRLPATGWVYIGFTVAGDGVTVNVYAGTGREPGTISLVGAFVLPAPLSPAVGVSRLTLGNHFTGPDFLTSGAQWSVLWAEARIHHRELSLAEINERRVISWVPSEVVRPQHLWRFTGPDFALAEDEDGGVDLAALGVVLIPQRAPTGDGDIPDGGDSKVIGQEIPVLFGMRDNWPGTKVATTPADGNFVSIGLTDVREARSEEAPFTLNLSFSATVDFHNSPEHRIVISPIVGQEDLTFPFFLVDDDGGLPGGPTLLGQIIEIITAGPHGSGELKVIRIPDDRRTIFIDGMYTGPDPSLQNIAVIRTPVSGTNMFLGEIDKSTGMVVVDRAGELTALGTITFTATGIQGTAVGKETSQSGLFAALLEEAFGFTGTINEDPSLLDVSPVGVGFELGGSKTFRTSANELMGPNWWRYNPPDDSFTIGGFALPGSPLSEIGELDISKIEELNIQRPWRDAKVQYAGNDRPQDPSSAGGSVPLKNRTRWEAEGQIVTRENPNPDPRSVAQGDPIRTAAHDKAGGELILGRVAELVFKERAWYRFSCASLRSYDAQPGETHRVTSLDPTLRIQAGQDVRIASAKRSTAGTIDYEVWGLAASQTLMEAGDPLTEFGGEYIHE